MVHEQYREQRHQVENRVAEGAHRQARLRRILQTNRVDQKPARQPDRADQVQRAAHAGRERQQRHDEQQHRIEQHLGTGVLEPVGNRQHRNIDLRIFAMALDR